MLCGQDPTKKVQEGLLLLSVLLNFTTSVCNSWESWLFLGSHSSLRTSPSSLCPLLGSPILLSSFWLAALNAIHYLLVTFIFSPAGVSPPVPNVLSWPLLPVLQSLSVSIAQGQGTYRVWVSPGSHQTETALLVSAGRHPGTSNSLE